ncbi:MAG TPA: hypothetical protein VN372_02680 [Methanospirillum sp.]|nr:hypothetical protein [Methanospirillum sp.]
MDELNLCQTNGIEEASFSTRSGEQYWILHQTRTHTYIRLDEQDYYLWNLMDGNRTITDLIMDFQKTYKSIPLSRLDQLIPRLTTNGFLVPTPHTNPEISSDHRTYIDITRFWEILFPIPNIDRFFSRLYGYTSWIIRSPWIQCSVFLISLFGLLYFIITEPLPSYPMLLEGDSHLIAIFWAYIAILISAILHECGHALACKFYGRTINNAGLVLYYGSPCLFVDTTDIWMAPPKARIVVSLAGPAVNLFIGSLCSLIVFVFPDTAYSTGIWRFAFISFLIAMVNLNPLLEFDGYYTLTDLLEIPNLRARAFQYIRTFPLIRIVRKEECLSTQGVIYLLYGVGGGLFTVGMILISVYIWEAHVADLAYEIINNRYEWDHFLSSLAIVLLLLPFIAGMVVQGFSYLRHHMYRQSQSDPGS